MAPQGTGINYGGEGTCPPIFYLGICANGKWTSETGMTDFWLNNVSKTTNNQAEQRQP